MPALLSEAFKDAESNIRDNSKLPTEYNNNDGTMNHPNNTTPSKNRNIVENLENNIQQELSHESVLNHVKQCPECKEKIIAMVLEESRTQNNILKNRIIELEKNLENKKMSFMDNVMEFIDEYPLLALLIAIIGIDMFSKIFKK